jgi:hypothetical protein
MKTGPMKTGPMKTGPMKNHATGVRIDGERRVCASASPCSTTDAHLAVPTVWAGTAMRDQNLNRAVTP